MDTGESVVNISDTPPEGYNQSSCFICDPMPEESSSNAPKDHKRRHSEDRNLTQACPTCDRDLSSYTPTRRLQHINRCIDQHNGIESEENRTMRSACIMESGGNRRKSSSVGNAVIVDLKAAPVSDRPPPMSMNMLDKDYICPICNKKLGVEFRTRVNHVTSCAAKNGVDAEKIGQLKRQQEASLSAERAAWEERHPEFARGDMSTSQPSGDPFPNNKPASSRKSRKKVTTSAMVAHAEQQTVQNALRPFFPSQLLDEDNESPNHSLASHQLTWGSDDTIDPERGLDDVSPRFSSSSPRSASSRAPQLTSINIGEYDSDWDREDPPTAIRSTQTAKPSRLASSASNQIARPHFGMTTTEYDDNDDQWDALPTQFAKRGEKRRAEEDLSFPDSSSKKPKTAERISHNSIDSRLEVIVLDSPVNSQGSIAPRSDALSLPITSLNDAIHYENSHPVENNQKEQSDSEDSDDQFWLRSLTGKSARAPTSSASNGAITTASPFQGDHSKAAGKAIEDEPEITSSPPTPPLDLCRTPPRAKRTSTVDDFIDLSSPVRVILPKNLKESFSIASDTSAPKVPEPQATTNATTHLVSSGAHITPRNIVPHVGENPIYMPTDETPFHTELDAIISKFSQLEKQAEEVYYATLGRIAVQRDQQIRQLARHFSIDMVSATRALHMRSAKFTQSDVSATEYANQISPPTSNLHTTSSSASVVSLPQHPPTSNALPQSLRNDLVVSDRTDPIQERTTVSNSSEQYSSAATSVSDARSMPPSASNSRVNSRTNIDERTTTNTNSSIQRPNFDSMSNVQLSALASKFGLQTTLSRPTLVSQLEAIWQHYKTQFSTGVDVSASNPISSRSASSRSIEANSFHLENGTNGGQTAIQPSNETVSAPAAKRSRAKATKASTAAIPIESSSLPPVTSTVRIDTSLGLNERLDTFIKANLDLYATMLHYTSVDVLEFQALLKQNKIKISRHDLQVYLQSRGFLYTLKKTASGRAITSAKR